MDSSQPNGNEDKSLAKANLQDLSKEQLIELLSGFQEMLRSSTAREKFIKTASGTAVVAEAVKRRMSSNSTLSYYKPRYARMVQLAVDKILVDKKNRVFRYEDFKGNTENTLYQKVWQGMVYLVDHMDTPEFKYAKAWDEITISKTKEGVKLEQLEDLGEAKELSETSESKVENRLWKSKLQDFIDTSRMNQKLQIKELDLSKEDIEQCHILFAGIESSFLHRITREEILVLHIDPEKSYE